MKKGLHLAGILSLLPTLSLINTTTHAQTATSGYPYAPVPFTSVKVSDEFWGERLKANREKTIPLAFEKCQDEGRYDIFVKAAHPSPDNIADGTPFDDTDVYKIIEGASYSLQTFPNKKMEAYIDSILTLVAAAQEPDGYLYTKRTMSPEHPHAWSGQKRWEKVEELSHEFYNLGHMIEGAIAHYQATGKRNFLDIAIGYADCVCREIGSNEGQTTCIPGHQIAEMALAKLYLVTGEKKYLDQAKFFLDYRGRTDHRNGYSQSHLPVTEQDEAVGHAVRAVYMYSGMADVAALTDDSAYIQAIDCIWENVVSKKLYITGGIGASRSGEAFGHNYELPNAEAYCETCAAIGNVYWNYRLFLLHGEARYFDVLERTLYNGLIAGVSLDGGTFFYPNPLESNGKYKFNQGSTTRQPWFGCACCPSNICRFIPSVPGYIYSTRDDSLYVNLFIANRSEITINGRKVVVEQNGQYPWKGDIAITVTPQRRQSFTLKIRIPGWVQNKVVPSDLYSYADDETPSYCVKVNGKVVESPLDKGYFCIDRTWKKGDRVDINFTMKPRMVVAHPRVAADRGLVAIERGPVVYCAEGCDNRAGLSHILLNRKAHFSESFKADLLHGIVLITTDDAQRLYFDADGKLQTTDTSLTLIPYYAWNHRGSGEMKVWLPVTTLNPQPATDK